MNITMSELTFTATAGGGGKYVSNNITVNGLSSIISATLTGIQSSVKDQQIDVTISNTTNVIAVFADTNVWADTIVKVRLFGFD